MGTCVSKCFPCQAIPCNNSISTAGIPCNNSISTAGGISQASPAVHPLPGEAGAASASPTTSSSLSLVASTTSLCGSSSSSSAASSSSSSYYLWRPRPRELVLLPNAGTSTSNSMSPREWDVVVLDPKSMSSDPDRCKPTSCHGSDRHRLAAPTPKRPRSVSPLSARRALTSPPGSYEQQQQHKKRRQNTGGRRSTAATQREVVALAQARNKDKKKNKTEVSQSQSLSLKISSSAHADSTNTAAALAQVTPDDDLTNPIISMDCFIFL